MNARAIFLAVMLAGCLLGPRLFAQYAFPPTEHEDMAAQLTVQAAGQTNVPGLGEVTLTLTVKGPSTLEVEAPHLGDAAAAWKEKRQASERVVKNQRVQWSQVIRLRQTKPGLEPLPDVSLRFRRSSDESWAEAKWVDILTHLRDLPGPPAPEEQPSWLRRWGFTLALGTLVALVLLAWKINQLRGSPSASLSPQELALRELERIEQTMQPPHGEAEPFYTQISDVVRRYLVDRFGFLALHQTTAEFLQTLREPPRRSSEVKAQSESETPLFNSEEEALLGEFFHRCDLAKFARAAATPEECRHTTLLARQLVQQGTTKKKA